SPFGPGWPALGREGGPGGRPRHDGRLSRRSGLAERAAQLEEEGDQRLALADLAAVDHGHQLGQRERADLDPLVVVPLRRRWLEAGAAEDVHGLVAEAGGRVEERDLLEVAGTVPDLLLQLALGGRLRGLAGVEA